MPSFKINPRAVVPAYNELSNLKAWLRPGLFSIRVALHVDALERPAQRLFQETSQILGECALHYPDVEPDIIPSYEPNVGQRNPNAGKPHPKAGQNVSHERDGGVFTLFASAAAEMEYRRREAELYSGDIEITVPERLTYAFLTSKIESERLPAVRSDAGPGVSAAVNFAAIFPVLEMPAAEPTQPPASSSNGTNAGNADAPRTDPGTTSSGPPTTAAVS